MTESRHRAATGEVACLAQSDPGSLGSRLDEGLGMSDVFISYARPAEAEAKRIAEALRALGYGLRVWADVRR